MRPLAAARNVPPILTILTFLLVLLTGCEKPAPSDYWTGGAKAARAGGAAANFEKLMAEGTRANLSGRPVEAEARFRDALSEQRKLHGNDSPLLALPMMSLALQLSAEGQFPQADAQFAEAERVMGAPKAGTSKDGASKDGASKDAALKARLLHYRAVHLLNQKKTAEAEPLLAAAQSAYTALIPPDDLTRVPAPRPVRNRFDVNAKMAATSGFRLMDNDPAAQPALLGLIEVMRYRAIALRALDRAAEADALTTSAARIASANDLGRPSVFARVFRTAGVTAEGQSLRDRALSDLDRSDNDFQIALPGTKPAAEAALIHAGVLMRSGDTGSALSICRRAVATLIAIDEGTSPDLMAPCLDAYAAGSSFFSLGSSSASNRADMFLAAQVAQGTITSHQIAQASVALEENARDPRIGEALRKRDELQREIDRIYRALDTIGVTAATGRASDQVSQLQQQADQTQAALAQAEAAVRTLSPNYGQLVQDVVPASAVFAALHPNEAFIALFLSKTSGWAFALRNGDIAIAKIDGGIGAVGPLVTAIRAGIEKTEVNSLPTFDIDDARHLYDLTIGGVAKEIKGASSLVIAPTGPLLSLPFEVLLTGPADLGKLAEAPWLLREATITHVPAATNFVSLRKVANASAATKPWFGFGDFRPVSVRQWQSAGRAAGSAGGGEGTGQCARGAECVWRRRTVGRRVHRRPGAEDAAQGLPHSAFRGARSAADRPALPDRGRDRDLTAGGFAGREGRIAERIEAARVGSRRQPGHLVRVQLGWTRGRSGRKPVRPRALVLLRQSPVAAGDPLGGERSGRRASGGADRQRHEGEAGAWRDRGAAGGAVESARPCRDRKVAGRDRASVLLGSVRRDRRWRGGWPGRTAEYCFVPVLMRLMIHLI